MHFLNGSNSVRATARHFDLQPNQVRDWRNKKDQLKASAPHLLKLHSGRQASFLELENELANWILECREQGFPITRNMATKKAKELAQTDKYQKKYLNISSFKFSNKWMDCFMNRYDLSNH